MGIVKIVSGEPAAKSGYSCGDEDLTRDERILLQSFPIHESYDSELAEVDCELAMSTGQVCNVPYELYDLPDLTEVLSLETWNSCLTEDDRFCLSAYLPDMEQHDFVRTMKELFAGDAMFFGSPLRSFFLQLNGGLYSPQVSQARELLTTFQRRIHYHFLKSYHDGMVDKFASMAKLLRSREKVPVSHNRVYEKRSTCGELSSSTLPITVKGETATVSPMKRAKLMDGSLTTPCSTRNNATAHASTSAEMSTLESQIFHPLGDPRQYRGKLPKGVLKIRTGGASLIDVSKGIHYRPGLVLVDQLGMQRSSFGAPLHAFAHDMLGSSENSSSHINTVNGSSASSRQSPLQRKGTVETCPPVGKRPIGVQMTVPEEHKAVYPPIMLRGFCQPATNLSLAYSNEAYDTRECGHMKDLLKNFGHENSMHRSSPDPCARVSDGHQMNGYTTLHSIRTAENVSEMLNLGTGIYPPHTKLSEQLETVHKYHDKPVTEVEEARQFAYTYARRKPHKRSTMVEDTMSPSALSMANLKAETIKL